jgi:hypothetical protein
MKFAIGVRIEGKSGEFQGVQGIIFDRWKVGSKNLLVIRWSDGRESRVVTGSVTVLGAGGPNEVGVVANQVIVDRQVGDEDGDRSLDDISQGSDMSEVISERDRGDQDGYLW